MDPYDVLETNMSTGLFTCLLHSYGTGYVISPSPSRSQVGTVTCHDQRCMRANARERQRVSERRLAQVRFGVRFTDLHLSFRTACSFCRESKKKCSGTAPCTQCIRRRLPQECLITYLPRGFRARNKHGPTGAGRQSWSSASQAATASAQEKLAVTLRRPSNATGPLSENNEMGTTGIVGPLSPFESQDGNDGASSHQVVCPTAMARLDENAAAEDTSLITPGPRLLLNSHGERGMSLRFL
jgi:hypothetical protein